MPTILSSKIKATATLDLFFRNIHHQLPRKREITMALRRIFLLVELASKLQLQRLDM